MNGIRLSLCLIARDSAKTLRPCLESIQPWVDEMVVVDTGSTDETPAIAEGLGAKVFHYAWCDDFSAARNESLRLAQGDWLFWMDSDDTIDEANGQRLRELACGAHRQSTLGYVMQVHCPGPAVDGTTDYTVVDHVKLIRNLPGLRFDGRIHEQVLPAIRRLGGDVEWTDIHVVHSGSDQSEAGRQRKQERDLRILHLELGERPEHPFTLFNLGMTYADMAQHSVAIDYLRRSICVSHSADSHLRKAFALAVASSFQAGQLDQAVQWCTEGLARFPTDPELIFRKAMLAHHRGQLADAEAAYLQLLESNGERHFSSVDPAIKGHKARHNLAQVYSDVQRPDLAEIQWRQIVRTLPSSSSAWLGLIETLIKLRRFQTADVEIEKMSAVNGLQSLAMRMKARLAEARGDMATAKACLLSWMEQDSSHEALEALCRHLFEHGDPAEARCRLEELAARCPDDAAVLHNLGAINMRLENLQAAVECYEASLRIRPDARSTWLELSAALAALSRTALSRAARHMADCKSIQSDLGTTGSQRNLTTPPTSG